MKNPYVSEDIPFILYYMRILNYKIIKKYKI